MSLIDLPHPRQINWWKVVAIVLAAAWVLPARYTLDIREPAEHLRQEISEQIGAGKINRIANSIIVGGTSSVLTKQGEDAQDKLAKCEACQSLCGAAPTFYFRHVQRRWYWPWWGEPPHLSDDAFPGTDGVKYTEKLTLQQAFAHGHLGHSKDGTEWKNHEEQR